MPSDSPAWTQLLAVGAAAAVAVALGMALGWLADSAFDSSPAFIITGLALGLAAATFSTISQFRKLLGTTPKTPPHTQP